jgi:thiamine biosynthesis protein ThiS
MPEEVEIVVNGFNERVAEKATISELIRRFQEEDVHLIVEHNGRFVFAQQYETTRVAAGDRIEFIHPDFGG